MQNKLSYFVFIIILFYIYKYKKTTATKNIHFIVQYADTYHDVFEHIQKSKHMKRAQVHKDNLF